MFSSNASQSRYKEASMCHPVPVFLCALLIHDSMQCATRTQPSDWPVIRNECIETYIFHVKNFLHEQAFSSALRHTSNVSLLQENVTPCCDLPKHSNLLLLLLRLLNLNFTKKIELTQVHTIHKRISTHIDFPILHYPNFIHKIVVLLKIC